ncbi:MAG: hypothetical protein Q4B23_05040 [Helcococcus sp.]|nr:hypothetical protein [Helcococcus sp.]
MTGNSNFILRDLNKEKYKKMHYVWSSSKVGFFNFFIRLVIFNLMILAISAMTRYSVFLFIDTNSSSIDLTWLKLDDFWTKIAINQYFVVGIVIVLLMVYMLYIWFRYANKDFQKFDQAWERLTFILFALFVFIFHILIMMFIPNYFNTKIFITMLLTGIYIIFIYFNMHNAIESFRYKDQSTDIIKINKITKKIFYILLFMYTVYVLIRNKNSYREGAFYFWLLLIIILFIHFIISPKMLGWQLKQIIFRNNFVKYSEEIRNKFEMTKEEWYGPKYKE